MIPVFQTKTSSGDGDCFAACLASILEEPLAVIPDFTPAIKNDNSWIVEANLFIAHFGFYLLPVIWKATACSSGFSIAIGNPKGGKEDNKHAVVYLGANLYHDPSPNGKGLEGNPETYMVFVALNPAQLKYGTV